MSTWQPTALKVIYSSTPKSKLSHPDLQKAEYFIFQEELTVLLMIKSLPNPGIHISVSPME
uniref:Uncharacterized protein n=1 Tax=Nelumbo nucifera TaxID=4432 RepID=A0A822Y4P4_NELNU|nr:TPA_asm: hypothetical protein HUJ06_027757 [Nelumbo nucifera]